MNPGNIEIRVGGGKIDTGKKWIDPATGLPHVIYRKTLALDGTTSSLPNATTKNVTHGEAVSLSKYAKVTELRADNATTIKTLESVGVTAEVNVTNIVVATTTDLSLYLRGAVTLEFCL
jgi:hypothetical protein